MLVGNTLIIATPIKYGCYLLCNRTENAHFYNVLSCDFRDTMRLVVCTADCLLTPVDDFNRMSVSSLPSSIAIMFCSYVIRHA